MGTSHLAIMSINKRISGQFEWGGGITICALALYLRWPLSGLDWSHVDERAFILYPLGFWSGDFNPHFFNYPTFHLYLVSALYYLYYLFFSPDSLDYFVAYHYLVDGTDLLALSRTLNVLLSVGTVLCCWRIGRRLYGTGGLLAAALLAVLPLHTRFAYLAITDVPATFWSTLAALFAVRLVQENERRDLLLGSLSAGLAAASKYPAGLALLMVIAAALLIKRRDTWMAAVVALLAFALTSPFVWLDYDAFVFDLSKMSREHLVNTTHSRSTLPWAHWLGFNLRHGLGWAPLATLLVSLAGWRRQWRREELVIVLGAGAFATLLGASSSVFMRYGLPLIPLVAVLMVRPLFLSAQRLPALALCAWCLVLLAEPLSASLQSHNLLNRGDTRLQAVDWLEREEPHMRRIMQIPKGAGQLPLLRKEMIYVRSIPLTRSYGIAGLERAYHALATGPPLPPLYVEWRPQAYGTLKGPPQPGRELLVLSYAHPLCGMGHIDSLAQEQADEQAEWVHSIVPGNTHAALFDQIDWNFLPVGNWQYIEQTGPQIRIGKLPMPIAEELPTSRQFFSLLASATAGKLAAQNEDWAAVKEHYNTVITAKSIRELLTQAHIYRAYLGLGMAYLDRGKHRLAQQFLELAIQEYPEAEDAHFELALLLGNTGQYAAALQHYTAVLEQSPNDADVLFNMGLNLLEMQRYAESASLLERSANLRPDIDTYLQLILIYNTLGHDDQMRLAFEQALKLAPDHPQLQSLQRDLMPTRGL